MPAYKEKKSAKWFCKFRSYEFDGTMKYITKRGFSTKHEAQEYETQYLLKKKGSPSMRFKDFTALYLEDMKPRVKESTYETKMNIIHHQIDPFFENMNIEDVATVHVMRWQNSIISYTNPRTGKPYTKSYLKTVHNQLSTIFNYGIRYYGLHDNPAAKVGNMGNDKEVSINFWTTAEYKRFASEMMAEPLAYYCFEMLYWTGIREGEMLALTLSDIDFEKKTVSITKTFHHINGHDLVTSPKTAKSNREVDLPDELCNELHDYVDMCYSLSPTERLFPVTKTFLYNKIKSGAEKAGLKKIRVHDLRHSHISMLINMGFSAVAIADRVGHESITITYRYAHMFESAKTEISNSLEKAMEGKDDVTKKL